MPGDDNWEDELDAEDFDAEPEAAGADDDPDLPFDPTYAGLGEWEQEIDEAEWIELACDAINTVGARAYLKRMLATLRESLHGELEERRELLDVLGGHLVGKRVTAANPLPGVPGALLAFEDGHAVPVVRPPWVRGPAPDFTRCIGQYLIILALKDDGSHPAWFELVFDPDPERVGEWPESEGVRLHTVLRSGRAVHCPYDHGVPLAPPDDAAEVLEQLDESVVGKRVADEVWLPGGTAALVFDDWHILPVAARSGELNLEPVVGRFLVAARLVEPLGAEASGVYVELGFADDAALRHKLRRPAAPESGSGNGASQASLHNQAGLTVIEATLDSVAALFWAADDEHPDWSDS